MVVVAIEAPGLPDAPRVEDLLRHGGKVVDAMPTTAQLPLLNVWQMSFYLELTRTLR